MSNNMHKRGLKYNSFNFPSVPNVSTLWLLFSRELWHCFCSQTFSSLSDVTCRWYIAQVQQRDLFARYWWKVWHLVCINTKLGTKCVWFPLDLHLECVVVWVHTILCAHGNTDHSSLPIVTNSNSKLMLQTWRRNYQINLSRCRLQIKSALMMVSTSPTHNYNGAETTRTY